MGKMGDLAGRGRTVLLVSHNMAAIQSLCTVAYGLDHGGVFASGQVNDVIAEYLESDSRSTGVSLHDRTDRLGSGKLRLTNFSISGAMNSPDTAQCGAPVAFQISYEGTPPLRNVDVDMFIEDEFGLCILNVATYIRGQEFAEIPPRGTFVCRFERLPLLPGPYQISLECMVNGLRADSVKNAVKIHVVEGDYYGSGYLPTKGYGHLAVPHEWGILADSSQSSDDPKTAHFQP